MIQIIWRTKIIIHLTKAKKNEDNENKNKDSESTEETDDEFNPTLAAMESEIKPKVLETINNLSKDYAKLIKYQKDKLHCVLNCNIIFSF